MKTKSKLWLLGLGSLLAVGVPGLVAASCKIDPAYVKGEFVYEFNAVNREPIFDADTSNSYGQYINSLPATYTGSELVRKQALTQTKTITITEKDTKKTTTYLVKPTFAKYRLELAEAIVLTEKGTNKQYVFDSDEIPSESEYPQPTKTVTDEKGNEYKVYEKTNVFVKTKGDKNVVSRSINSAFFLDKLANASKLQFVIRKGVKWVDHDGKDTGYEVKAKDFWYSWLRTYSRNLDYRLSTGGSKELDEALKSKLAEENSPVYGEQWSFGNIYTYALFGIDANKLFEKDKFIQKVSAEGNLKDREAITFESITGKEKDANISSFFESQFASGTYDFMPAPSDYIDALNAKNEQVVLKSNGNALSKSETEAYRNALNSMDKESLQYKIGQYWYGTSAKSTLYSGYYYNKGIENQIQKLPKNTLYWDKKWVEDDSTIKTIVFNFQSKAVEPALYNQTAFRKYSQGTISQIGFSSLTEPQKKEVSSEPEKFGLKLNERLNVQTSIFGFVRTPFISSKLGKNYKFNENFAKLVYGSSLADLDSGKADTSESYLFGKGLSFRTLLYAAVNWDTYAAQASSGQATHWLAKVPEGSNLGGSDQGTANLNTVVDFRDQANSLFAIDKDGNKVDFGKELGKELSPSENAKASETESSISEKMKSAGFKVLQTKMKELLDQFFKEQNITDPEKQTIEFEVGFRYLNAPQLYINAWEKVKNVFSELDPRIKVTVKSFDDPRDPNFDAYRFDGLTGENLLAWSADYNGVASTYDGLSWGAALVPTLVKVAHQTGDQKTKFKQAFPEIAKLADKLLEYAKTNKPNLSLDFDKIDQIDNRYLNSNLPAILAAYKLEQDTNTKKYVIAKKTVKGSKPKPIEFDFGKDSSGKSIEPTDLYQWSAIFWANTFKNFKNDEISKIVEEFTTFVTLGYASDVFVGRDKFVKTLINKHYVSPTIAGSAVDSYQDWRIIKDTKK